MTHTEWILLHDEARMSIFYISVRLQSSTFAPVIIAKNKNVKTNNYGTEILSELRNAAYRRHSRL